MKLQITASDNGTVRVSPPRRFRLTFLAIALIMCGVIATAGGLYWPHILLLILALGGLSYREEWLFNRSEGFVRTTFGLYLIYKKREWELTEGDTLVLEGFTKGFMGNVPEELEKKPMIKRMKQVSLLLKSRDEDRFILETAAGRDKQRLTEMAEELSGMTGLPLESLIQADEED